MRTAKKIYEIVSRIPTGRVATYGMIADLSGVRNPRLVGNILHKNPDPENIPCHRVINFKGELAPNFAFGGLAAQKRLLTGEGVDVAEQKVDLKKYSWNYSFT